MSTRGAADSERGGLQGPPAAPPRARARYRQLLRTRRDPLQVNLRWLVALILLTVVLPTIVLTGIGIAVIVARRAPFDVVFGVLVVVFAASVIAGAGLLMFLARRGARLARLQETFLSRVGHELMTPIAGIRLHGEILESVALPPEADASVRAIRKETERLQSLVERVLRWRSVRSPEHLYDRAPTTVDRVVERALDRLPSSDGIVVEIREPGLALHADEEALAEALANLLQNALKYAGNAGPVELVVRHWTRWALFAVRDRGPGLPDSRPERIFLPFFRDVPAGREDPGGTGLGLTIARQVALAHGGRLNATPRSGGGARFTLVVPLRRR